MNVCSIIIVRESCNHASRDRLTEMELMYPPLALRLLCLPPSASIWLIRPQEGLEAAEAIAGHRAVRNPVSRPTIVSLIGTVTVVFSAACSERKAQRSSWPRTAAPGNELHTTTARFLRYGRSFYGFRSGTAVRL